MRATFFALLEACLWTVGYLASQGVVLAGLVALLMVATFGLNLPDVEGAESFILDLEQNQTFLLIGATSLGAVFLMLFAVRLREGKHFRERIGWRRPNHEEIIFSLATVIPIAIWGDLIYEASTSWFHSGGALWPFAAALRESSLEYLNRSFEGVSYPILIVAMALGPAVGEELVFRGVLGRRLLGRFGVTRGIAISSVCFAAAHGSPAHAVATLPVAVLLHLLYLQTRTIWIPIHVHFCNNLLAISMVRFQLASNADIPPIMVLSLSVYLVAILALLHSKAAGRFQPFNSNNISAH